MLYLIHSNTIIKNYLNSSQLKEAADYDELCKALFHQIYSYATPYNTDIMISYSGLKKLSKYDTNHTKNHVEEILEQRVTGIGRYKRKNIDFFILETSKKNFEETKLKLSSLAERAGIKFDSTSLSLENISKIKEDFKNYYSNHTGKSYKKNKEALTEEFFKIKNKYNNTKIPNMNRLTAQGLSKFDDWFVNGYVSYKHVLSFARNELKISAGKAEEKSLFKLFGYLPSDSEYFSESAMKYIKKLVKASGLTIHRLAMMIEYYEGNKNGKNKYSNYKPSYEYLLLGEKRNINRQFLIYLSLALGLSLTDIKKLFKLGNCVLTDFLKEDILLCYFAENDYLLDIKQRGNLFKYLRYQKYD